MESPAYLTCFLLKWMRILKRLFTGIEKIVVVDIE